VSAVLFFFSVTLRTRTHTLVPLLSCTLVTSPTIYSDPDDRPLPCSYADEEFDKYLPTTAKIDQPATEWSGQAGNYGEYGEPPSRMQQCRYKLQNGFMIGATLGGAVGFLYGTWAAFAYKHVLYLPIAVVQSGGAFGLFLACGTVIRCEETGEVLALQQASSRAARSAAHRDELGLQGGPTLAGGGVGQLDRRSCTQEACGPTRSVRAAPRGALMEAILSRDA
jgi:hypothetical protein